MAWWRRRPPPGVIFHSDRGSQYCSHEFQDALKGWGMRSSMSRKGNCWDNAPTESFWGRLKTASVHGHKFATREQARQAVMDWMAFYNHRRLHSSLGYLSPMQYEQRWGKVKPSVTHALGQALAVLEALVALRVALQPYVTQPPEGQHRGDQADPYPNQLSR
eukprot:gene56561-77515_t